MNRYLLILFAAMLPAIMFAESPYPVNPAHVTRGTQWYGKRVAYLGDSMTDPRNKSARLHFWNYLDSLMGMKPEVFARSGYRWNGIYNKAVELSQAIAPDSIDAILIWAGTNDYNGSVPLGEFYTQTRDSVNVNGKMCHRLHRTMCMNDTTFCGNINRTLHFLKTTFPTAQIVIMTPIHRGYANFNEKNVQPDEMWANGQDLYVETYIDTLKKGAQLWAVPVIDLFADGGLMPVLDEHTQYFHKADTDRLHPNDAGQYRLARTIQMHLNSLPVDF